MAPFSIPAPMIIPLRIPVFGRGMKSIDNETKIEISCETLLDYEVFYTLDGTKPQPYAGIVQGSKLFKYKSPICLPVGKVTIKAIALNARVHTMRSSIVTKTFDVSDFASPAEIGLQKEKIQSIPDGLQSHGSGNPSSVYISEDITGFSFDVSGVKELNGNNILSTELFVDSDIENSSEEDVSESQSSVYHPNYERGVNPKESDTREDSFLFETENLIGDSKNCTKDEAFLSDYKSNDYDAENEEHNPEVLTKISETESQPFCTKCEKFGQHCISCNMLSDITSKYCIQCGKKLLQTCTYCKELNYVIAAFCQSCGRKLVAEDGGKVVLNVSCTDRSIMAEPLTNHASVQCTLVTSNKYTQTSPVRRDRSFLTHPISPDRRCPPSRSPGRGYWRQQMDYICNHLKSFAYNNTEFRDSISEPVLSEFETAHVIVNEDNVSITVKFTPFILEETDDKTSA